MQKNKITQVIQIYRSLSVVKKSFLWYTFANILLQAISFITMPIFTRIMSEEQYGLVSIYNTWQQVFVVIATFCVFKCVTVGIYKVSNKEAFLSSIQGLSISIILIWIIISFFFRESIKNITGLSYILIVSIIAQTFFSLTITSWNDYQRINYNYLKLVAISFIISIGSTILGLMVALNIDNEFKATGKILSQTVITTAVCLPILISVFKKGKTFYHEEYWKYALTFSLPLIFHQIAHVILSSSDRIMIERLCGINETAYYSVAYNGAMIPNIIANALVSSYTPWFFEKLKNNEFLKIKSRLNSMLILFSLIPLFLSLIAPEVVKILAPSNYYSAIWVVPPVAASVYFTFLYGYFVNILFYHEKTKIIAITSFFVSLLNILLNFFLLPIFGFAAAGYTTLFCYIVYCLFHFINSRKICKKKYGGMPMYNLKFYFWYSIIFLTTSIGILFTYEYPFIRYTLILIAIILIVINKRKIFQIYRRIIIK